MAFFAIFRIRKDRHIIWEKTPVAYTRTPTYRSNFFSAKTHSASSPFSNEVCIIFTSNCHKSNRRNMRTKPLRATFYEFAKFCDSASSKTPRMFRKATAIEINDAYPFAFATGIVDLAGYRPPDVSFSGIGWLAGFAADAQHGTDCGVLAGVLPAAEEDHGGGAVAGDVGA